MTTQAKHQENIRMRTRRKERGARYFLKYVLRFLRVCGGNVPTPTVLMKLSVKTSSAYLFKSADFPTPESPITTTFKSWSAPSIASNSLFLLAKQQVTKNSINRRQRNVEIRERNANSSSGRHFVHVTNCVRDTDENELLCNVSWFVQAKGNGAHTSRSVPC